MAISFLGSVTNSALNGGNVSLDLSGLGLAQNDIVVVAYMTSTQTNISASMDTVAGDYTEQAALYVNDSQDVNFWAGVKRMTASPDTSVTVIGSANVQDIVIAAAQAFRGVDATTALDATTTTASGTNAADINSPSITTVTNGAWVVSAGANSENEASPLTAPSGYTNDAQLSATDDRGGTVVMASREIASAGAENPAGWTGSGGNTQDCWAACSIALRPAAGGGGVTSTGAVTLQQVVIAGAAAQEFKATGALALASTALAGSGLSIENAAGTGAIALAAAVLNGPGTHGQEHTGSGAVALPPFILAGSGLESVPSIGQIALQAIVLAGSGQEELAAQAALQLHAAVINATAQLQQPVTSTGAIVLSAIILSAVGRGPALSDPVVPAIISGLVKSLVSELVRPVQRRE